MLILFLILTCLQPQVKITSFLMLRETLGPKDAVMNNGWKAQCKYKSPKDHEAPLLNEGAKKEGHC